ncbi:membrane protein insertase YidC [Marinospirillum alkaliphilum]|uniref:Membrane protein insertase YidC n=1 Tax=Marinospirillum alkaliphilum DSM 21637 TaxID=1122209 RepID=A0A1K1WR81_9GAMM|nr:membrane protein insertase YidC [Marinospirillum alkaliphilum]SFX39914.1 protein translocase subunit yidC [Marinospirillum alkaliphilum DSM 21637]
MDVKRIVLFSSLAVVAYLLIIQWNKDYQQQDVQVQAPQVQQQASVTSEDEDAVLELDDPTAPVLAAPARQTTTSSGLISVRTDTLDIRINPRGGDLVYAALLRHKTRVNSDNPFVLLQDDDIRHYVVQSDISGLGNQQRIQLQPEQVSYQLEEGQNNLQVRMTGEVDGIELTKVFTFTRGSHLIQVDYEINNQSDRSVTSSFIGLVKRDSSPDPSQGEFLGMSAYLGGAFSTDEKRYEKVSFRDIQRQNFQAHSMGGWAAMLQHYFLAAWIPPQDQMSFFSTRTDRNGNNIVGFRGAEHQIHPGETAIISASTFVGPKVQSEMKQVAPHLDLTVDYGWLWFIAQPLFWLLDWFYGFVGNWGVAIILVTVVIKLVFYKLSATAYRSMANMRRVAPKLQKIKEDAGDDRQKLSQAMMELYRKEKINPMGGCLPILVQMPVFIALYWMLLESVELRHAPFMLWIADLSMKDPYFVLPILMGVSMYLQQLLNPTPPDPMQAKIMKMLPVIFTFFFLFFPAGLVLYWLVNNILSILQQWYITRKIEAEDRQREKEKEKEKAAKA